MIHFDPLSFLLGASVALGVLFIAFVVRDAWRNRERMRDDYIDWSKVPEGWDWVAIDSDRDEPPISSGVWCYHNPIHIENGDHWDTKAGNDGVERVPKSAIIGPLPPWRESLRHRPGK